jgi:3-oxoacyl-[acyl-carrier protein] reductase
MSRKILITGATSSFGQELIARMPSDALIIAQSRDSLPPKMAIDKRIISIISDFSTSDFLNDFEQKVDFESVDEVVHFAAADLRLRRFIDTTSDQLMFDYKINFISIVSLLTKILETLKNNPRQIKVVIMVTDMIRIPKKGEISYMTSKYALLGLVNSLLSEFSGNQLRINAISPSFVDTRFVNIPVFLKKDISNKHPMKRFCTPAEVVDSIEFLLSTQSSFINGQNVFINGGGN